jgi:hypothetical protein
MTRLKKLLALALMILAPSALLNAQGMNGNGTIIVDSDGYGKSKQSAIDDAQFRAFEIILFRGIPGTDLNRPLIENEGEARATFGKYFSDLKAKRYKTFITNTSVTSEFVKKSKKAKNISVQTEINYKALRTDLEQNQVIRKFGL